MAAGTGKTQSTIKFESDVFDVTPFCRNGSLEPVFSTSLGALFKGDCLDVLPAIADASIDTVFADPPFNLGKEYGSSVDDNRESEEYLKWCHGWIAECIRVLKEGGAFFLYNIPKWNLPLGNYLMQSGMCFAQAGR